MQLMLRNLQNTGTETHRTNDAPGHSSHHLGERNNRRCAPDSGLWVCNDAECEELFVDDVNTET